MAKLHFKNEDLRKVQAHNQGAKEYRRSMASAFTAYEHEVGKVPDDLKIPDKFYKSTKPRYWLVKDEGIYLMSAASGLKIPKDGSHVAYAKGYNPKTNGDVWDRCREAVGGDDFVEDIPAAWLDRHITDGYDIIINITSTQLSVTPVKK